MACLTLCDLMDCSLARLFCPWYSPDKITGVGCHCLLQGIFLTQGSNSGLLYCRQILYYLSYRRSPHDNIAAQRLCLAMRKKLSLFTAAHLPLSRFPPFLTRCPRPLSCSTTAQLPWSLAVLGAHPTSPQFQSHVTCCSVSLESSFFLSSLSWRLSFSSLRSSSRLPPQRGPP